MQRSNSFFLILTMVVIVSLAYLAVSARMKEGQAEQNLNLERYNRMVLEEKREQDLMKIKKLQSDLDSSRAQVEKLENRFKEQETIRKGLSLRLEKMKESKDLLEQELDQLQRAHVIP